MTEKEYSGILAEPIPNWTSLTRPSDDEIKMLMDAKINALFAHYSLDPNDMPAVMALVLKMARRHVVGFKTAPKKQGRPSKNIDEDFILFTHVELLKRRDGVSEREAIKLIAEQKILYGTLDTLRTRYKMGKKNFKLITISYNKMAIAMGKSKFIATLEESLNSVGT